MTGNTKEVKSNQTEIHRDLKELVLRYLKNEYRRPIAEHTIDAFHKAALFISAFKTPVVLDSGCGTGLSTIALAKQFPENPVLGIDKSEIRLVKAHNRSENGISMTLESPERYLDMNVSKNQIVTKPCGSVTICI